MRNTTKISRTGLLFAVGLALAVGGCDPNNKVDNSSDSGKSPSESPQPKTMRTATAAAEIGGNKYWCGVTNLVIADPGEGYPDFEFGKGIPKTEGVTVPTITITGGGGKGALAHVESVTNGKVTSVLVESGGDGYTNAPKIEFQSPQDLRLAAKAQKDKEAAERKNLDVADREHKKGTERSKCADNMHAISCALSAISTIDGKVTVEALAEHAGAKGVKPQCPFGGPYFIAYAPNLRDADGEKVLIYCAKHLLVETKYSMHPTYCDATEFKTQIENNLLNTNDIGAEACKIGAAATPEVLKKYSGVYETTSGPATFAGGLGLFSSGEYTLMFGSSGTKRSGTWTVVGTTLRLRGSDSGDTLLRVLGSGKLLSLIHI